MRELYNRLVAKSKYGSKLLPNGKPVFDLDEALADLNSLAQIFRSREKFDYQYKCGLLKRHSSKIGRLIETLASSDFTIPSNNELKLICSDIITLQNFITPRVSVALNNVAEELYTLIRNTGNHRNRNDWTMLALKFLAHCKVQHSELLDHIKRNYAKNVNKIPFNVVANTLYYFAMMRHFDDDFLSTLLKKWNARQFTNPILHNQVLKAQLLFARRSQLLQTNLLINKAELVEEIRKINADHNEIVDTSEFKTQTRMKRAATRIFHRSKIKHIIKEEVTVIDYHVDLVITSQDKNFPFIYMFATDGLHHYITNTLQLTPKEQFRHDVVLFFKQLESESSIIYRRFPVAINTDAEFIISSDLERLTIDSQQLFSQLRSTLNDFKKPETDLKKIEEQALNLANLMGFFGNRQCGKENQDRENTKGLAIKKW